MSNLSIFGCAIIAVYIKEMKIFLTVSVPERVPLHRSEPRSVDHPILGRRNSKVTQRIIASQEKWIQILWSIQSSIMKTVVPHSPLERVWGIRFSFLTEAFSELFSGFPIVEVTATRTRSTDKRPLIIFTGWSRKSNHGGVREYWKCYVF